MSKNSSLKRNIIRFIIPLMLANLLQVFYSAADTMVVSLSCEPDAVGAIGTTTSMINLIVNIFIGCAVGAKVTISNAIGAGDEKRVQNSVHTAVLLSIILGFICTIIGIFVSEPVLRAMKNAERLLYLAKRYSVIYFCGGVFISLTNFASAVFHAKSDTKTPLKILIFCGFVNVVLNLFFVLVCKMSVEGVAISTVMSNALSALLLLLRLGREKDICNLNIKKLRIEKNACINILRCGIPAGVQSALFSVSHMVIQSSIVTVNNLVTPVGSSFAPVVKGCAACASIEGFGSTAINAVSQAAITFTGQNAGAKKYDEIKKVQHSCYLFSFIISLCFAAVIFLLKDPLLMLYGITRGNAGTLEETAYNASVIRMMYMFIPYFFLGFMEVGSGVMQGLGKAFTSMSVSVLGSVIFRIIWIMTVFNTNPCLENIFVSFPISWIMTATLHFIFIKLTLRTLKSSEYLIKK